MKATANEISKIINNRYCLAYRNDQYMGIIKTSDINKYYIYVLEEEYRNTCEYLLIGLDKNELIDFLYGNIDLLQLIINSEEVLNVISNYDRVISVSDYNKKNIQQDYLDYRYVFLKDLEYIKNNLI